MKSEKLKPQAEYLLSLGYGSDIISEVLDFSSTKNISAGFFEAIGAVQGVVLAYYDQQAKEYLQLSQDERMEIASCMGNICEKEGERFAHAHITCARGDGSTLAGHLVSCKVFACELRLKAYENRILRQPDEKTGLWLMDLEE